MADCLKMMPETSEDWAAAKDLADLLGVPCEEMVREFAEEFEQLSPEEQAEFMELVDQVNVVMPAMNASLDSIEEGISRCGKSIREMTESVAAMSQRVSLIEADFGLENWR